MEKGRDKRVVSILMTLTIIFTLMGGTLSYLRWQTSEAQRTNVVFTVNQNFSCAADGGGDIASASLMPASCTNPTYAIQRTVTVTPTIKKDDLSIYMDLWLDINELGSGLSQSEYFKYALTTEENSCTTGIVSQGTFTGLSSENDDKVMLLEEKKYSSSAPQTYYLYIWIDPLEENDYIVDQPFNFSLGGSCTDISIYKETLLNGADPKLETGMIPVTISDTGAVTVANVYSEWYNYEDKQWANAVLVNSTSRSTYINQDGTFNANTTILEDEILAYYVWIPRYKYTFPKADGNPETISIIFENNKTTKSVPASGKASGTEYYTHPAFTFGAKELNGIWVGKFETTGTGDTPTIKPNTASLIDQTVSVQFTTSLKFAGGDMNISTGEVSFIGNSIYGLTEITDTHMMKNSEWGAVAYLSHSTYGINAEIGINSNSSFTTGAGNEKTYGTPTTGNYTYPQSTTGNITGVFDMSGGALEYVMGTYRGSLHHSESDYSDFSTLPDAKYYDNYTNWVADYCSLQECGGHALKETKRWYSDSGYYFDEYTLWLLRGGLYRIGDSAGAFYYLKSDGKPSIEGSGFRAVLVKGT